MKVFLRKLIYFILILISITFTFIFVLNFYISEKSYTHGESESNLFFIKKGTVYDHLVLGISHGRSLSRNNHHQLFENVFKSKMINLSQGNALGGLENQLWYFEYFLKRGNKAKTLILVLSPMLMYSNNIDNNSTAFFAEPIHMDFVSHILKNGGANKYDQIFHHFKSKLSPHWWNLKPKSKYENTDVLSKIDSNLINEGIKLGYPSGLNAKIFEERKKIFSSIINKTRENNITPVIVIPPAIFGKWPGHDKIVNYLQTDYSDIQIINCSELTRDIEDYYDHHHLNTNGMIKWMNDLHQKMKID